MQKTTQFISHIITCICEMNTLCNFAVDNIVRMSFVQLGHFECVHLCRVREREHVNRSLLICALLHFIISLIWLVNKQNRTRLMMVTGLFYYYFLNCMMHLWNKHNISVQRENNKNQFRAKWTFTTGNFHGKLPYDVKNRQNEVNGNFIHVVGWMWNYVLSLFFLNLWAD